ncbi:SixA phosphatase family protein [Nitrosophilus alvini]|uniref:SixA phosphatase family protein n=1 Tax=Nitrosophilus alvini TaxID=2714855 RepID=UPI00190AFBB0|nr:histidine phosphatase family protein [Nitrosophilus alvini]
MRLLFIRHAKALERFEWHKDDLLRPLSEKGAKKAEEFFKKLPKIYDVEVIITSKATRALQTADILYEQFPNAKFITNSLLNPGSDILDLQLAIKNYLEFDTIAVIGHEPDFSEMIGTLTKCRNLNIRVKKASVIELSGSFPENMELCASIYPKLLEHFK